jgi:succinoglycan biosynthesis transport protein ExoP
MRTTSGERHDEAAGKKAAGAVGAGVVLRGLRRYPLTALAGVLFAIAAAAAVWLFLPLPKMTGYAVFQISSSGNTLLTPVGDAKTDFRTYSQAQAGIIKSRLVVSGALNQSEMKNLSMLQGHDDPLTWLVDRLQVDFKQGPEFMRLSLEGDDRDQLEKIVGAISKAYLARVAESDNAKRQMQYEFFDKQWRMYQEKLQKSHDTITRRAKDLGASDPKTLAEKERTMQEGVREIQRTLFQIRDQLWRAKMEVGAYALKASAGVPLPVEAGAAVLGAPGFASANAVVAPLPDEVVTQAVRMDPHYKALDDRRSELEARIDELRKQLEDPNFPLLKDKQRQLEQVKKDLQDREAKIRPEVAARIRENASREGKQQLGVAQANLRELAGLEAQYRRELDDALKQISNMNASQVDLEDLKRQIAVDEKMAERYAQEAEAIRAELTTPPRVQVWESPTVVPGIEGNRRLKYSLMAGGAALALAVGLTTLREVRNRRVLDTREVTGELGLKVLGTVPAMPRGLGRGPAGEMASWQYALTESVDTARTVLLHGLANPKPSRTILVASAMPGEGKTSLSGHLAISLAQVGYRTLLVDGDMRRPEIHRVMGLAPTPGLCEVLLGECSAAEAIRGTAVERLSVMPAGRWDRRVSATLAGDNWRRLRGQLEAEFDFVVVDSAPVLSVTDSLLMARHTDGVVLSALWNATEFATLAEARERLAMVGGDVLGVVLSGVGGSAYLSRYNRYGQEAPSDPRVAG